MSERPYNGDVCLESRVRVLESLMAEREKVLALTAHNLNVRLELLNELRGNVMTKAEYDSSHNDLLRRIGMLETFQSRIIGIGIAIVAGSFLVGLLLSHFMKL